MTSDGMQKALEFPTIKPSAVAVIDNFFGYEGIRTRATATDMSDGERLVMWLRVNGLKIVPMTHLDCTDD